MPRSPDARSLVEKTVRELLRALADLPREPMPLHVTDAEGVLACLIQVWPATELMPAAAVERRRRISGRQGNRTARGRWARRWPT